MKLNDDEILFFEKLNNLNIRVQTNIHTKETRLLLCQNGFEPVFEIFETAALKEREKHKISLIRKFLEKNGIKCKDTKQAYEKHG